MRLRPTRLTKLIFALHLLAPALAAATEDPRLQKDGVSACVEAAKSRLPSTEYYGESTEQALITACSRADRLCVEEASDSLHPSDSLKLAEMIQLIKACHGHGMGKCLAAVKGQTASFDRREVAQVLALIKKCD